MENTEFLDFDAVINEESEQREFELLEPGEYTFTLQKYSKEFFHSTRPDSKIKDGTPMVKLEFIVTDGEHSNYVYNTLFLRKDFEWKISSFFLSVGLKKHNEPLRIDFDSAIGKKGRCKITKRSYTKQTGETVESNDIASFLEPTVPAKRPLTMGEL